MIVKLSVIKLRFKTTWLMGNYPSKRLSGQGCYKEKG